MYTYIYNKISKKKVMVLLCTFKMNVKGLEFFYARKICKRNKY